MADLTHSIDKKIRILRLSRKMTQERLAEYPFSSFTNTRREKTGSQLRNW